MERRLTVWETGILFKKRVFLFQFDYDEEVKQDLKRIGCQWEQPMSVGWQVSAWSMEPKPQNVPALKLAMERWTFRPDESALGLLAALEEPEEVEKFVRSKQNDPSRKESTDFYPLGLEDAKRDGVPIQLYPFQRAGVEYALEHKRLIIGDQMGLGKSVQAIATVEHIHKTTGRGYPAVIVCPASLKLNWERELSMWVPDRNVCLLSGKGDGFEFYDDENWIILNYDILGVWLERLRALRPMAVVYDEGHYLKSEGTNRTRLSQRLARGEVNRAQLGVVLEDEWKVPTRIILTGTAAVNKPKELATQLGIIEQLGPFGGYTNFLTYYCGERPRGRGRRAYTGGGATPRRLNELNTVLRATCYLRREKSQVLKDLPAKIRSTVMLDIDNWHEYKKAESDIANWVANEALQDDEFIASLVDMNIVQKEVAIWERRSSAYARTKRAEALVRFAKLKQLAAQGKMVRALEWIRTFIDNDEKIIVFAHHDAIVKKLGAELNAPIIAGSTPLNKRQQYVDMFQTDTAVKAIVLNMQAGGVGLNLTAASNVAFVELGWTPAVHDQCEDRAHRIGQTDSVTAWYLLGANTVDEQVEALIARKREVVDHTNIGKYVDEDNGQVDLSILKELTKYMLEKAQQTRQ